MNFGILAVIQACPV